MSPVFSPNSKNIAVFDFDGTLTYRDSFLPFLRMALGPLRFDRGLLVLSPLLAGYSLGLVENWRAKLAVVSYFLTGLTAAQLEWHGQRFAKEKIPQMLRPSALERLRWHQAKGHETIVVSASLEAYLLPLVETIGVDRVIGSKLEVQSGVLTGKLSGKNCYGPEKVARLQALLGDLSQYSIYAYGDSRGDKELLAAANYPYYRKFC